MRARAKRWRGSCGPICAARRIKLLIADDPGLALRMRADGVHLPQRRASKIAALKALHPRWLVTAAAHDDAAPAPRRDWGRMRF